MTVFHVPGDRDMPEWWTEADDAVLRGELAKLAELPRPLYVERAHNRLVYLPITEQRHPRSWFAFGVALVLVGLLMLAMMIALVPSPNAAPSCAPACVSTTPAPGPGVR